MNTTPGILYRQSGNRALVMVNNPEFILTEDLADAGGWVIHREQLSAGNRRVWSSLNNRSGAAFAFRVTLRNPGPAPLRVLREAAGTGAFAHDFPAAWNAPLPETFRLAPGETLALLSIDNIPADAFFGGLVDFHADGPLILDLYCAREPDRVRVDALNPMGYITRAFSPTHREARVYKGSNPHTVAELRADWHVGDGDAGPLPVLAPDCRDGWLTHITRGHRAEAVMSDMFAFRDPTVDHPFLPDTPSDALGLIPNFGNWGVVYRHHGCLHNHGPRARRVRFHLAGEGLHLAVQTRPDAPWQQHSLPAAGGLDWASFELPPGTSLPYDARLVLGGPSNGCLRHTVHVY